MDIFIGFIVPLLATAFICASPFLFEKLAKRINPKYETYSEFLAKMSNEEKAAYSKKVRKYKSRSKIKPMPLLISMHKRVKSQRYGGRR